MANLKEIRNRIVSVTSTMQITSAMKMVSAAKLKKAQDSIIAMRPYVSALKKIIKNVSGSIDIETQNTYTEFREKKSVLIIAITSNRGLCGAFNANIIKKTRQLISEDYSSQKVSIVTIGKKGSESLSKTGKVVENYDTLFEELNYDSVEKISLKIMEQYEEKTYDEVIFVYNRFKNAATQIVEVESFLPLIPDVEGEINYSVDYLFEPTQEEIVNELIPKFLKVQFFKTLCDSFASEHGARMTAMHKATDNATELRDQLKLTYNKARQAAITNEILEIVGGAEALNN